MSRDKQRVLVVGGGIAGQALAPALSKRGIECEIVEIKPRWDVIGAGMYVHSNALRALAEIGVVDEIVRRGWPCTDDTMVIADTEGRARARPKLQRIAGPAVPAVVPIKRQTFHEILNGATVRADIPIRMGVTVTEIRDDPEAGGVDVTFSDGSSGSYDLVVGADGIRSVVRDLVFGPSAPRYSGFVNWRVILPLVPEITDVTWMYGDGTSIGIIPFSSEEFYLAGVTQEPETQRYPREDLPRLMREKFSGYGGLIPRLLQMVTEPDQIVYTRIEEILQPLPWYKGRVVLVGDAAHASTPFWAQGASMAIEDAIVLADVLDSPEPLDRQLDEWMARRKDRCLFVQRGSLKSGQMIHSNAPGAHAESAVRLASRIQAELDARYGMLAQPI